MVVINIKLKINKLVTKIRYDVLRVALIIMKASIYNLCRVSSGVIAATSVIFRRFFHCTITQAAFSDKNTDSEHFFYIIVCISLETFRIPVWIRRVYSEVYTMTQKYAFENKNCIYLDYIVKLILHNKYHFSHINFYWSHAWI